MFITTILFAFLLRVQVSLAEGNIENVFYKTNGPYFVSKKAVNWTEARAGCVKARLEFASIVSKTELTALKIFIRKNKLLPEDKWSGYWLSGIRHEDGNYYWNSTGSEVDFSFNGWALGEPSHAYNREDCMELKWDGLDLGWNDYFCDETRRYICEVPRKEKPKFVKKHQKKVHKPLVHKEWEYPESFEKFNGTLNGKESDYYDYPEASIDYNPDTANVTEIKNKENI